MPLYFILILAIIRMAIKDKKYDPITEPHGSALLMKSLPYLLQGYPLHIAPNTTEVRNVGEEIHRLFESTCSFCISTSIVYHESEEELIQVFQNNKSMPAAVVFSDDPLINKTYVLRFNPSKTIPSPSQLWTGGENCRNLQTDDLQMIGCPPNGYYFSGFSALQTLIDTTIIRMKTNTTIGIPNVILENFPKESYESNGGFVLRNIVPLYMVFAWAQFIVYLMNLVVEEKEKKIKESMKMMGLRDSVYWLSWFAVYAAYVVALAVICIIVLPLAKVFLNANLFLLFILFILYGCSSIVFALMMTPFFNKAKVAGVVGNLIQVALSMLFYLQVYLEDDVNQGVFWLLAIFSPCAFSFAIDKVILYDYQYPGGLDFGNIWEGPGLPFAGSLIMISVDILLYLSLAYYLDNVIPSEYGTKRKPWFLFQKSFWVESNKDFQFSPLVAEDNAAFEGNESLANPDLEPVSSELSRKVAVRIRNLTKTFYPSKKEPVKAVDDFSLDIYQGQITAILGHNGAGKTTLFNVLTGMTAPTQGSAKIFGMDVCDANDLTNIRRITGICPQHDVVFMTLTPREHLRFFAQIRGIPSEKIKAEVEQTLKNIDLYSKGDTKAANLSGGQKRKLSIGIALIGDPKIVFLDEPTAGVDAYSRRRLWTLLKNKKEGKVILLTTHFMDEADILADRKAVVSRGRLRCCGSSLFLKNKFGLGYHLTLVVAEDADTNRITKALEEVVPRVQMARFYGKELSFILPAESAKQFPSLFNQLDQHITVAERNLGIESYGISMTTLEEVFLVLSEENEESEIHSMEDIGHKVLKDKSSSSSPLHTSSSEVQEQNMNGTQQTGDRVNIMDTNGFAINAVDVKYDAWRAFKALLKIRFINVSREVLAVIFLIFFPLAFVIGSIALADSQNIEIIPDKALHLVPEIYEPNLYGLLLQNSTDHELSDIESVFEAANMAVDAYSGNYTKIPELGMHMAALNVASFPRATNGVPANLTLLFNDTYLHSIPILVNLISNAILRSLEETDVINVSTHLLPSILESVSFDVSTFMAPMMIGYTFSLIPAGLVIDLVYDREIMARNLLRLNGVGFNLYFSSFFIVMGVMYMVSYIGLLIIIAAFQVPSLIIPQAYGAIAILYLLYMPCALTTSAVYCYIFDKSETARQFYPPMSITIGFLSYTAVSLVYLLASDTQVGFILHIVLAILFPQYIPFGLLFFINRVYVLCSLRNSCGQLTASDYMTPEINSLFVIVLVDIFVYYILLRLADTLKLGGSWREALWMKETNVGYSQSIAENGIEAPAGEDDDVKEERSNVAVAFRDGNCLSPVLIYDLGKEFKKEEGKHDNPCKKKAGGKFVALKSLSLEVKPGQVFGLLGPNGAGKTTSLRIMTAEEKPTKGKVQICGENVASSMSIVFKAMGYCPQHDALWKNTTVAEHIECYAEVRGIQKDQVKLLINTYLKGLEIEEHRKKKSKNCSGGTKRKLSYIISMIGHPKVVLLDEPSTGLDPKSKRFLWNSILASFKDERSAILTTHSMEEADALCARIGILVQGSLRCVGAIQHLKNKYGGGYTLEIKIKHEECSAVKEFKTPPDGIKQSGSIMEQVHNIINETFPNAVLDEQFEEHITYKVPQHDISDLARCFMVLEKAKSEGLMEEYALSQTTLEQVFLKFARQQEYEDDDDQEAAQQSSLSTTSL
ncbi:cholesterol transporter ABCA5 isoform X2 [Cherax quadricarinatus]